MCWTTDEARKSRSIRDQLDQNSDPDDPLGPKFKDPYSKDIDWDHFLKIADGNETHYSTAAGDLKVLGKQGAQSNSKLGKFAAQSLPKIGAGDLKLREASAAGATTSPGLPTIPTAPVTRTPREVSTGGLPTIPRAPRKRTPNIPTGGLR